MNNYILTESITNTIVLYIILKKLLQNFEDWDAYKLGIIDKDGNKLKDPTSSKEREAWDLITRFCWNFKKIIIKFIGKSKFSTYFTAAYLLKDSFNNFYISHNQTKLNENILNNLTFEIQNTLYNIINEVSKSDIKIDKINEENFEFYMFKLQPIIEKILEDIDFEKGLY